MLSYCLCIYLQKEEPVKKAEPIITRPKTKSISLFGGDDEEDEGDLFGGGPPKPQPQKQQVGSCYRGGWDARGRMRGICLVKDLLNLSHRSNR